jgi:adenylylsulfate kinase
MVKLFLEAGVIALTAFISPFRADRDRVRSLVPHGEFLEIYCRCPLEICEERDVKGLYHRARAGEIKDFTGISSPYEEPIAPELVVETGCQPLEKSVDSVIELLRARGVIGDDRAAGRASFHAVEGLSMNDQFVFAPVVKY